mgnify:CR=1 FL=1
MQQVEGDTIDPTILQALSRGHTIDITTTGRRSGLPRRIELVFPNFDGRIYLPSMPRPGPTRPRLHNLPPKPQSTFHLQ